MHSFLNDRALICLKGNDKYKFLQGLITNDMNKLNDETSLYACMLTPQGKYFADFFLKLENDSIFIDIPLTRRSEVIKKLTMYKLRSDITIDECPEYRIIASLDNKPENKIAFLDPRSSTLGWRAFVHNDELIQDSDCKQNAYDSIRIDNFIAEGEKDLIAEKSFPLEYGFDQLNAIDYKKGCYMGQELTARTHYSGVIRKQIAYVTTLDETLPPLGTLIQAEEQKLGIMCSSLKNKGLALIRTEEFINLDPKIKITTNNQEISIKLKTGSTK